MSNTLFKLGPQDAGVRLSRREFAEAECEKPFIYERVHGRLVVMSPPGREHRNVGKPFRRELGGYWQRRRDIVDDVDFEGWVATSDENDRLPDICVYPVGNESGEGVPERVPDLIYEFVSETRADQERDYIHKREEYHRIGVKEYVIVDRFKRQALVLTWAADDYAERVLNAKEAYATPLLPGLTIQLSESFAE